MISVCSSIKLIFILYEDKKFHKQNFSSDLDGCLLSRWNERMDRYRVRSKFIHVSTNDDGGGDRETQTNKQMNLWIFFCLHNMDTKCQMK